MAEGQLIVVTGVMAAGKSTVAQALAERLPRSAHVRGDAFRRFVVAGREDIGAEPSEEAFRQLRLRYRLAIQAAEGYAAAGFTTVLQDVVIGPMLEEFVHMVAVRPFSLVVLAPDVAEVTRREAARSKTGYGAITPLDLDAVLRQDTARIGLWVDSTDLTVDRTVDRILADLEHARID
ncbi:MAG: AAA family ATPase [Actinomycetota bacterium]